MARCKLFWSNLLHLYNFEKCKAICFTSSLKQGLMWPRLDFNLLCSGGWTLNLPASTFQVLGVQTCVVFIDIVLRIKTRVFCMLVMHAPNQTASQDPKLLLCVLQVVIFRTAFSYCKQLTSYDFMSMKLIKMHISNTHHPFTNRECLVL